MRGRSQRWRHLPAVVLSLAFVAPLVLLVPAALRDLDLPPPRTPELIPPQVSVESFGRAVEVVDLARYALNSLIVAGIAVPLAVLVASWAGLAISRLPRRAQGAMVGLSLVALMVPLTALLVPRFTLFRALGLTDTYVPLIAPALLGMSPFYVLFFYWSFRRIPGELFEAARLEGVGTLTVWWRLAMPLVRPVTVAVAVLAFLVSWSNFLDPLIYLYDEGSFTLPLGLKALALLPIPQFPVMLAGALIAIAPAAVVFLVTQRFIQRVEVGP